MAERDWTVHWEDNRKHIVFENQIGDKVRDSNIENTFSIKVSKEALTSEFERQNEIRSGHSEFEGIEQRDTELERYYAEIESVIAGAGADIETVGSDPETGERTVREDSGDTEKLIRDLAAQERTSGEKRNNSIAERENRDDERERQRVAAERAALEAKRRNEIECTRSRKRSRSHDISR